VSPLTAKPVLHGRDHCPGGADPIPCLPAAPGATYAEIILAEPCLVGYWPLNESSGDAADLSGHGYTLTKKGTPTYSLAGPFASEPAQTAVHFDYTGTETGAVIPAEDAFYSSDGALDGYVTSPTGLSVEAWVYPTANPAIYGGIMQSVNGGRTNTAYVLQHRSDGEIWWQAGDSIVVDPNIALTLNAWTHIVGTTSTTAGTRLYLNGALVGTPGSNFTPVNIGAHFAVAALMNSSSQVRHFVGRIAQCALYSCALTAAQVLAHYEGSTGGTADGAVLTSDGAGGTSWTFPMIEVDY
jgi:hypothetical protein